ncbi:MAG: hypothetical protein BWZ00_00102 [Bacteroidetes bacterium ADurb.BinA174]|nr:MAG: hypothetical protein BWZ00_00102 [Bacteroidetes bacterium ADurb.BinA174]
MKIFFFPLLITLIPVVVLLLFLRYWKREKSFSLLVKILVGSAFLFLAVCFTYLAMRLSIEGHMEKGISCATGVITFIPISLILNGCGIPLILILENKIRNSNL